MPFYFLKATVFYFPKIMTFLLLLAMLFTLSQ